MNYKQGRHKTAPMTFVCERCHNPILDRTIKRCQKPLHFCKKCVTAKAREKNRRIYERTHPKFISRQKLIIDILNIKPTNLAELLKITGCVTENSLTSIISKLRTRGYDIQNHSIHQSYYVMSNGGRS